MSKAGNSETQCREFATDTIADITATVTGSQTTMDAIDTGASCAAEGQDAVAAAQAILATKTAALVAAQATAATALSTKQSTCTAAVDLPSVNLDALQATTCYDYTTAASYTAANEACDDAIDILAVADQAVTVARTEKSDAETALAADVAEASRLESGCLCRVHKEQKAAWTAVESATASHEAEWQQAQQIICALARTCYSACSSGRSGSYDACGTSVYVSGNCRSVTVYDNDNSPDDVNFGAVHGSRYLNLPYDLSSDCA